MHDINTNLSKEELSKLISETADPVRKAELIAHLSGLVTQEIIVDTLNINESIARGTFYIREMKDGVLIGTSERKPFILSPSEITAQLNLAKTHSSLVSLV